MRRYTTVGNVRGSCGHHHQTIESAVRCMQRDQADCKRQGGYSDRNLIALEDGRRVPLKEAEYLYSVSDECDRRIHSHRRRRT